MRWFRRRRRRVDVGTFVEPAPVEWASDEEQIEDGLLIALSAVRLTVTNRLIVRSLRDGLDYDERRLRLSVIAELLAMAREKETDAERFRATREEVRTRVGRPETPADYRSDDAGRLGRRAIVSEGLATRLRELSSDPDGVGELAERAHRAALDEFEVSVVRGVSAFDEPDLDAPMSKKDRANELRGLAEDLDDLARLRRATGS